MTALYLLDDAVAREFEPFSLTRPVGELRAGAELLRHRWEVATGSRAAGYLCAPHLRDFAEFDAPACLTSGDLPAGAIVANARCAPALHRTPGAWTWHCDGRIAAVRLPVAVPVDRLADGTLPLDDLRDAARPSVEVFGWWLDRVWDLVRHLSPMLAGDIAALAPGIARRSAPGPLTIGTHEVVIEEGATIEPMVAVDASAGPVLIRAGATIAAFTRLAGPCVIGRDTQVLGGRVSGSAIGESCRVHGELSSSIFIGHANKGHDGFVGHSVLGRWTNLGAGTVTSNLKNTYGSVRLPTPRGEVDTGLQFLGTLLGDHAKTGIGTRLTTGTVVGAGANVVFDGVAPGSIAPFAWGDGTYRLDKFLEVASRVMARRHVTLDERGRAHLARVHVACTGRGPVSR